MATSAEAASKDAKDAIDAKKRAEALEKAAADAAQPNPLESVLTAVAPGRRNRMRPEPPVTSPNSKSPSAKPTAAPEKAANNKKAGIPAIAVGSKDSKSAADNSSAATSGASASAATRKSTLKKSGSVSSKNNKSKDEADKTDPKRFETMDIDGLYKEINKFAKVFEKAESRFNNISSLKSLRDLILAGTDTEKLKVATLPETEYVAFREWKIPGNLIDLSAAVRSLNILLRKTNPNLPVDTIPKPKELLKVEKPGTLPNAAKLTEEERTNYTNAWKQYQQYKTYQEQLAAYEVYERILVKKENKLIRWFNENADRLERAYQAWLARNNKIDKRIKELLDPTIKVDIAAIMKKAREEEGEAQEITATFEKDEHEQFEMASKAAGIAKAELNKAEAAQLAANNACNEATRRLKEAKRASMTEGAEMLFTQAEALNAKAENELENVRKAAAEITKQLNIIKDTRAKAAEIAKNKKAEKDAADKEAAHQQSLLKEAIKDAMAAKAKAGQGLLASENQLAFAKRAVEEANTELQQLVKEGINPKAVETAHELVINACEYTAKAHVGTQKQADLTVAEASKVLIQHDPSTLAQKLPRIIEAAKEATALAAKVPDYAEITRKNNEHTQEALETLKSKIAELRAAAQKEREKAEKEKEEAERKLKEAERKRKEDVLILQAKGEVYRAALGTRECLNGAKTRYELAQTALEEAKNNKKAVDEMVRKKELPEKHVEQTIAGKEYELALEAFSEAETLYKKIETVNKAAEDARIKVQGIDTLTETMEQLKIAEQAARDAEAAFAPCNRASDLTIDKANEVAKALMRAREAAEKLQKEKEDAEKLLAEKLKKEKEDAAKLLAAKLQKEKEDAEAISRAKRDIDFYGRETDLSLREIATRYKEAKETAEKAAEDKKAVDDMARWAHLPPAVLALRHLPHDHESVLDADAKNKLAIEALGRAEAAHVKATKDQADATRALKLASDAKTSVDDARAQIEVAKKASEDAKAQVRNCNTATTQTKGYAKNVADALNRARIAAAAAHAAALAAAAGAGGLHFAHGGGHPAAAAPPPPAVAVVPAAVPPITDPRILWRIRSGRLPAP